MSNAIHVAMCADAPSDDEWRDLQPGIPGEHQFLSRGWYCSWGAAFLPMGRWDGPLQWLVARDPKRGLMGVLPLAKQRIGMSVTLSLAGYYWPFRSFPFNAEFADDIASAAAAWATTNAASVPWRFGPVPRGTRAVEALIDAFTRHGWLAMEKRIGETYSLNVGPMNGFDEAVASLKKKVSYYERRMRRSGDVDIRTVPLRAGGRCDELLRDLETIEERSWVAKQQDGKPKFIGARNRTFWTHLSTSRHSEMLQPMLLYFGGRPVSYSLNIDAGNTRYIIANGYDEEFAIHSPGMLLTYYVLRDAETAGRSTIEWGQGDSGYKSRWGAVENLRLVDLLMLPRTASGYIGMKLLSRAHYVRLP